MLFRSGGTASRISDQSTLDSKHKGVVKYDNLQTVERPLVGGGTETVVMNRTGFVVVQDDKGRDRERYQVVYGARMKVKDGEIMFPKNAAGRKAVAEGVLKKIELNQQQAIAFAKHEAEERGQKFDPAKIKSGMTIYQIQGTGAVLLD